MTTMTMMAISLKDINAAASRERRSVRNPKALMALYLSQCRYISLPIATDIAFKLLVVLTTLINLLIN